MSLLDKINQTKADPASFTQKELEFLLVLIKDVTFKGEYVEMLYNIVDKIQKQHSTLEK